MTERSREPAATIAAFERLADDILPALVARLDGSGLGELEVRDGGWRVRLRRDVGPAPSIGTSTATLGGEASAQESARTGAMSPAVGYFVPNERTAVGRSVAAGDPVGWVEVLGVRHEVVAPRDGTVGRFLVEPGQAVEYGQELVILEGARRGGDAPPDAAPATPESA